MSYELVPIPYDKLMATAHVWAPHVTKIAEVQRCFPEQRFTEVFSGEVGLMIVRKAGEIEPIALLGWRNLKRGNDRIAELIWLTGKDSKEWVHLYPVLEQHFRECGFAGMATRHRPGWSKFLRNNGYKITHVEAEKDF